MTTTMLLEPTLTDTATRTSATDDLRRLLGDVLLSVASDDDTDRYAGRLPTGQALLSLATLARRAAWALGAEPGTALTGAPGVVVLRELAAAARLLDEAAEATDGESWEVADLLVRAERLQSELTSTGR